jgi:RHS repeat-associated protein
MLYCGEQFDANLHQYYLRARYYDQGAGRFNSMDSFEGNNFDPQSLHKYAYCHCDPLNNQDPTGMFIGGLIEFIIATALDIALVVARWMPVIRFVCAITDILTIVDVIWKIHDGETITAGDIARLVAATAGLLLGPLAKVLIFVRTGLTITKTLRTLDGALEAVSRFCHVEAVSKVYIAPGLAQTGEFLVDVLGNPVIRYVREGGLKTAHTLIHELLHYWRWRRAGRPVGEAYEAWKAAEIAWEDATRGLYMCADGTTGLLAKISEIILELAK